jgi:serine/threonine protein kinase
MGTCSTAREYDEEMDDNSIDYKVINLKSQNNLRKKAETEDPLYSTLIGIVPNEYLSLNKEQFKRLYRVKKNIKCEENDIYEIKVLETKLTGQLFNAKIIKKETIKLMREEYFKAFFIAEIKSLININHPNCERLIKIFILKKESTFILIMITNYCPKKSLLDVINEKIKSNSKFTKKELVTVAKVLSLIAFKFKSVNIIFRNFSPDNIFFLKENQYLTLNVRNFYFSTVVNKTRMTNGIYGGLWYLSPEQLKDLKYDFKSDIWGIGMILYMMITFENPFTKCDSREEVFEKLKKKETFKSDEELIFLGVDRDILRFMRRCLNENQKYRANPENLLEDDLFRINETESNVTDNDLLDFIDYNEAFFKSLIYKLDEKVGKITHGLVFYILLNFAKFFIEDNELIKINEIYCLFDKNNNSFIAFSEITELLKEKLCQGDNKEINSLNNKKIENYIIMLNAILFQNPYVNEYHRIKDNQITYDLFFIANILLKILKLKDTYFLEKVKHIIFDQIDINDNKKIEIREFMNFFKKKINSIFRDIPNLISSLKENKYMKKDVIDADLLGNILSYEIVELSPKQIDEINSLS